MPYATILDLPAAVRDHLPPHGQEIYRKAFNNAWQSYAGRSDHEEIAHRVAWAAVKSRYRKRGGAWVEKETDSD